jgi:TatD DNase family protein
MFVDTHAHLYINDFENDLDEVIERAKQEGVGQIFLPAIDSQTHNKLISLTEKYPNYCYGMMGLHPCDVKENYKDELQIAKHLIKTETKAIGEIGLDFYWDKTFAKQQVEAFQEQINWALALNLPINIHSRNSMQDCINIVKDFQNGNLKGIFHCFSGSYEIAKQILDLNFYLGIGGVVTYKNAGLPEILKRLDLKYLVLETDSPYLTPVPYRGKRNESSYIKYVAGKIAETYETDVETVGKITTANSKLVYGI